MIVFAIAYAIVGTGQTSLKSPSQAVQKGSLNSGLE